MALETWDESRTEISMALDLIPMVGDFKSLIEASAGYDLAGNKLTDLEKSLMLVGGLVGMFTLFDEVADAAR